MEETMTAVTMADAHRTTDLFFKVSSFIRYLLDDVLPAEVYNKQSVQSDTLDDLVEECETLSASLRTFNQLTKVLQASDTVSSSSQTNEPLSSSFKVDEQYAVKFTELCDDIRKKVISLPDMIKFKPYYCKICNLATWYEPVFNRHCTSKKHIEQTNRTSEHLAINKCKTCHLLLMAPKSEINSIISLPAHSLLDEHINELKGSIEKNPIKNFTNSTLYRDDSDNVQGDMHEVSDDSIKKDITNVHCLPHKVNQLFQIIKSFKASKHLLDDVPHYCNVCDIMVYSVGKFIDHTSSKEHIAAVNSATNLINVFKCEKCGFLITGFETVIDGIINSNGHQKFDEFITDLRASKEAGKIANESLPAESSVEKVTPNTNFPKESFEQNIASDMLKKSITSLIEILRLPTDLKKHVPSCCFLCKKIFSSSNDFKQHIMSRKHITIASSFTSNFYVHYCPFCSLSIYGSDTDIQNALAASEHINLHKRINYLFHSNNETGDMNNSPGERKISTIDMDNAPSTSIIVGSCSNDIKKLVLVNDPKQASEKSINSLKGTNLKAKPLNRRVPDKFLTINCKLQCGDFSKSGFCRPCIKGVNIMKGWANHLSCSKHKRAMDKQHFENIPLPCEYCSLQILGDQIYENACMDVHIKLNHPNVKKTDIQKGPLFLGSKEEISERVSGTSSNQSKSPETIGSNNIEQNRLQLNAENMPIQLTDDLQPSPWNQSRAEYNDPISSEQFINQETSNSSVENKSDRTEVFIQFLNKRKAIFLNEGLKKFGGMCLFCVQTYDDFFEWLLHLKDPCHKLVKQLDCIEKECKDCNLSLFGRKTIIENEFWHLREHISLDALVTQ